MARDSTPKDDEQLMSEVASGDREALGALYERYAGLVFRIAYRFLFHEEDARDITHSVFVTLLESAHRYRPRARFSTWLYRVVSNRCLNHRSRASRRRRASRSSRASRSEGDPLARLPAPDSDRPDLRLERVESAARVRAALLELPDRQRLALYLRRFEELTYDEIADAMGCSRSSVESLLFRARRRLRKDLSE